MSSQVAVVIFAYVVTYGFVVSYALWMRSRRKRLDDSQS
jgi:hypothetical protein